VHEQPPADSKLKAHSLPLGFRDYTQSLCRLKDVRLFGHVLGAELEPPERSVREVRVGELTVLRRMAPFKLYHDCCSRLSLASCAYGPCWEGAMAQLNLCLDKIVHPARDPSRPMPWWDKSRLYLHGRFTSQVCKIEGFPVADSLLRSHSYTVE
jgi:hypothetical protein